MWSTERERKREREADPCDWPEIKPTSQHRHINCGPTLCLGLLLDPLVFPNKPKWGQLVPFPHSPIDCLLNRLAFERAASSQALLIEPAELTMNADFFFFFSHPYYSLSCTSACVCVCEREGETGCPILILASPLLNGCMFLVAYCPQ